MSIFSRLLIFVGSFALGFIILRYNKYVVDMAGKSEWAEEKLGAGGTYTAWKLFGIAIIIFGFLWAMGALSAP